MFDEVPAAPLSRVDGPLAHLDAMHRLELNEIHAAIFNRVGTQPTY